MPHLRRLVSVGIIVLAAAALMPGLAAVAAPGPRQPAAGHVAAVSAATGTGRHQVRNRANPAANPSRTCSFLQYYCDWSIKNGSNNLNDPGVCLAVDVSVTNWGACRNVDESFFNATLVAVRLFYSPSYVGAWICIPATTYLGDLSNITFNNGTTDAGYGDSVFNDVASSQLSSADNCTNPTF
jgi:hypothetical protein